MSTRPAPPSRTSCRRREHFQTKLAAGTCYSGGAVNVPGPCPGRIRDQAACRRPRSLCDLPGWSGADQARAVAVDSQGNVWITGDTESPDFPTTLFDGYVLLLLALPTGYTMGAVDLRFHGEIDPGPLHFGAHSWQNWISRAAPCFIPRTSADRRQVRASPSL